jgi:hypothetical protein
MMSSDDRDDRKEAAAKSPNFSEITPRFFSNFVHTGTGSSTSNCSPIEIHG